MSDAPANHTGLTRRELEREAAWMMRHLPSEPEALAKLLATIVVALIDKNNAAIAKRAAHHTDDKPGAP